LSSPAAGYYLGLNATSSSQGRVAAASADVAERITVAAGRPIGDVPATALLVRPDGYVAWASSATEPEVDDLRGVLRRGFGIATT
jgi:hypothetical protein